MQCAQPAPSSKPAAPAVPAIVTARKRTQIATPGDVPPTKRQAGAARNVDLDTAYRLRKAPGKTAATKAAALKPTAKAPTEAAVGKGPLAAKAPITKAQTPKKQARPQRGAAKQARRALAVQQQTSSSTHEEPFGNLGGSEHTVGTVSSPAAGGGLANLLQARLPPPMPLASNPPLQRASSPVYVHACHSACLNVHKKTTLHLVCIYARL